MTYKAFIDRVNAKVRTADDWPDSGSAIQEQVDLSFLAALAVATEISLSGFSSAFFDNTELTDPRNLNDVYQYQLPSTVFRYRQDLGIVSLELGDKVYELNEGQTLTTLRRLAKNPFYCASRLFSANIPDRKLYVLGKPTVRVNHLKEFVAPALASIDTEAYPLEGVHSERAASIVSTHVQGEKSRDMAAAQFQALLQRQYTSTPAPAGQTNEPEQ